MSGERRREIVRDGIGVGVATGAYGLSFGALGVAAGLSVAQTCALSLLMFTGASQFAFIGVVASGGAPLAGAVSAILLGTRNALYGLRVAPMLGISGPRRFAAAQLVIDESTAMGIAHDHDGHGHVGFWAGGLGVYVFWNLGTLVGALGARFLPDPAALGLDAAVPAAFLALLGPRLRGGRPVVVALAAGIVALALAPVVPAGVPVLAAALVAVLAGWNAGRTGATT